MEERKYDVKRGADTYQMIYHSRLKNWILRGMIKRDEALVWRSGLSGWRRPEDLPELKPYFDQREEVDLKRGEKEDESVSVSKRQIGHILIVDDEEDLCWLLSASLSGKGYRVSTANTVREAAPCLKHRPDFILLDLKLPDGDGMDLIPEIRTTLPEAIVVIISAYGSEERKLDAKGKGVHRFIDKPLTEETIMRAIAEFQQKD